jgi:hypothetical protein
MPRFFGSIREEFATRFGRKDALSPNEFVGFQSNGAVVIGERSRQSTRFDRLY